MCLRCTKQQEVIQRLYAEILKYVYGIHITRGIKNASENHPVRSIQDRNYKLIWNLNYEEPFYCSASRLGAKMHEGWLTAAKGNSEALSMFSSI